ncbi:glycosyl hydrolase 108 family protein [Methylobacterium aquaticum]|uniref:Putative secretion activating protein n=1 Tax=Methylobacterium aquaticum TaxID=270351 RepID=A0A0C6FC89_9HYPH|nr:glycosyl hydrolase 108 family protein [Methylobacterium aquaticum]BAQ50276.1 putative secretion activating protein [Methylobacterium aquaticum]
MPNLTSAKRLEACLPFIFHGEGGYTANAKDPGNWTGGKVGKGQLKGTKYGISAASYPTLDIKNLTRDQAAAIYRRDYWDQAGCHELPAGPDLPILDVSVNSGPGRANVFRRATEAIKDGVARIKAISAKRRAFYQGLSTFKTFGKGWMSRVATIEAAAIKMALAAGGASPVLVAKQLQAEAGLSDKKVKQGTTAAGGTSTAAVAGATQATDWLQVGLAVAVIAVAIVVAIHFIRAHQERAMAFRAEALKV